MEPLQEKDYAFIEQLSLSMGKMVADLQKSANQLTKKSADVYLQKLHTAVHSIDTPVVWRSHPFDGYMKKWLDFTSGSLKFLDGRSIRYLAWLPEVAVTMKYLDEVERTKSCSDYRVLIGLVRSCHCKWNSFTDIDPVINKVSNYLMNCEESHQIITRWKTDSCVVLRKNGPRILAENLLNDNTGLIAFIQKWRLDAQSPFVQDVVRNATVMCRQWLPKLPSHLLMFLFRDLLPWPGWDPSILKKEIGALILHKPMTEKIRLIIQRFIFHCKVLGDPTLDANKIAWSEVPKPARVLFTQWLKKEAPVAFSEHVYKQGRGWSWQQRASSSDPLSFEDDDCF